MGTVKETLSSQRKRWRRCLMTVTMLCVGMGLLAGCSAGGNDSGTGNNGPVGNEPVGSATLLPPVKMIDLSQADYVATQTATTWTLRTASSVKAGDVLLLKDAAVKVLSVDTSSGQTVLTVAPAEIQDVFSKLSLQLAFDQNSAEFVPDPSSNIQATLVPSVLGNNMAAQATASVAAPIVGSVNKVLTFPYNDPPFSANLSFTFLGNANFDYDSSSSAGLTGALGLTGIVDGNTSMTTNKAIDQPLVLAEKSIGTLRIPVPISVTDALLQRIGIYTASIYVPISVGAEVESASIAGGVNVNGTVQSTVVTTYNAVNGFVVTGPQHTGSLTITGIASSDLPGAVVHGSLMVGPFIKASPQLLILNKVASIGADIKAGLYGHGQVGSFLNQPYYCFDIQGMGQGTASGFFKTIAGTKLETPPISKSLDVGPRFLYPLNTGCSPAVQFSAASYTPTATARSVTITVTRTGDPSGTATVQYTTNDDTAVAGRDYTAASGTLTFNPTETEKVFTIPILRNPTSQGGTVVLTLSQPSTGTELGTPSTAVLTITSGVSGTWIGPYSLSHAVVCSFHDQGTLSMSIIQSGTSFSGTWSRTGQNIVDANTCAPTGATDTLSGTVSGTLATAGDVTTLTGTFKICDACGGGDGTMPVTESWTASLGADPSTMTGKWTSLSFSNLGTSSFTLTKQ